MISRRSDHGDGNFFTDRLIRFFVGGELRLISRRSYQRGTTDAFKSNKQGELRSEGLSTFLSQWRTESQTVGDGHLMFLRTWRGISV